MAETRIRYVRNLLQGEEEIDLKPWVRYTLNSSTVIDQGEEIVITYEIVGCAYEEKWTDEVGNVDVCVFHGQNSKYSSEQGPSRPCLEIAPWE